MSESVQKLIDEYTLGRIVESECIHELCKTAAAIDPRNVADGIPPELIDKIRELTEIPRADELRSFAMGSYAGPRDLEGWNQKWALEQDQYARGLRTWKAYFESKI